jgi:hypothetical protein
MDMDLKKEFGTDKTLEEDGAWIDMGDGTQLKIARAGNKKASEYARQVSKPFQTQIRFGKFTEEGFTKLAIEVAAQFILLDWKNLQEDGVDVPYSKENALRMLTDYPDFRNFVSASAEDIKNYQKEGEAVVTKK